MSNKTRDIDLLRPRWMKPLVEEPISKDELEFKHKPGAPWRIFSLCAFALVGVTVSLIKYLRWRPPINLASTILWILSLFVLIATRPRTYSLVLTGLYIAITACQAVAILSLSNRHGFDVTWDILSIVVSLLSLVFTLNMPLRHPFFSRAGISIPFTMPTAELRSPEDDLTMWQWMSVSWMAPLISLGLQRQLNDEDIWLLAYEFQHTHLHAAFRNLKGTVIWRLIKANWIDIVILTLLACVELAATYSAPIILQKLLQAMQLIDVQKKPAVIYAFLTLVVEFAGAQSGVFSTWFSRRSYERTRGAMITMMHEKVLHRKILGGKPKDETEKQANGDIEGAVSEGDARNDADNETASDQSPLTGIKKERQSLSESTKMFFTKLKTYTPFRQTKEAPAVKEPASMGMILNLMRNDIYQIAQRFWEMQMFINTPIGLVLSLVLVWRLIGWASLIGVGVVIVAQAINVILGRILLSVEKTRRKATDRKLQQITQYVEAIRHLRWYGWQTRKLEAVLSARQKELNLNIVTFIIRNAITFVNTFASGILPVAAFWAYTALAGHKLSVDIAFPALQLFQLLQTNLRDIPNMIMFFLYAVVAVGRLEDFMSEPDVAPETTTELSDKVELREASFSWPGTYKNVLHELDVTFPPGLTIVVGPVASGKSALLQALLGELDLRGGKLIRPDTPFGYCSQTPWLESMTIRDNILFCSPYDETKYRQVLDACALLPDLASFEKGDLSPIGENGIGLSGGQKARVALARAIYSQTKVLLLDDPLSALDQQTAEWIVSKCLSGKLVQDRTVILVTHRTDLCKGISTQVLEIVDGQARVYSEPTTISDESLRLFRIDSPTDQAKHAKESDVPEEKFEDEEYRRHGGVQFKVYWEYVKAGKLKWWFLVVITIVIWRLSDYGQNWYLKVWGEAYHTSDTSLFLRLQTVIHRYNQPSPISRFFDRLPDPALNPNPWLFWFMIFAVIQSVAFLISQVFMLLVTYTAGKNMFHEIMVRISNATFRFYDVTPVGRLMNRLTGDVGTVDGPISSQFVVVTWELIAWITSVAIIASVTPVFLIFSIALTAAFVYIFFRFLPTSQSLRRLEMVSLSPLMSNFGALLNGLITVRAFHAQHNFQDRVIRVTDNFQKMDHFYWSLQAWLQYRFDSLSAVSTFLLTLLAIYSGLSPGLTAFVLIAAQRFVQSTHRLCKRYGQLQLDFVSVERVVELLHLDQENKGTLNPPASWPLLSSPNPAIEFSNVTISYAPHLPPALKNISFSIPPGSSTAIIGRTGSGKSTLALAMLATTPPTSGTITIDGIDISQISKQALRSRITFLAQDPILFEGSLRTNLDPLTDYSDAECEAVLARIHGPDRYGWTLTTPVEAGGRNLSQGQRQLVGLARAILRRSAIVIMDEATASVDLATSWEVQRVVKEELRGSTVVTIAHRAAAVRDCDLVVKLDKGEVVAVGKPEDVEGASGFRE